MSYQIHCPFRLSLSMVVSVMVAVCQIPNVYTTCITAVRHYPSICTSYHEYDIRGKWLTCEFDLLSKISLPALASRVPSIKTNGPNPNRSRPNRQHVDRGVHILLSISLCAYAVYKQSFLIPQETSAINIYAPDLCVCM